jgi:exodeoxyribonuclease VII large subunit
LLAGVAEAVERVYPQGDWTIVDLVQVNARRHVFLEVAERDAHGVVLAKANAMIWADAADEILPAFEAATGMSIGPGM